jgi:tRNA A-37 threonylcarbamoyl transferase component Bud32
MSNYSLEKYTLPELKKMASRMDLKMRRSRSEMIKDISEAFQEYEEYKHDKLDRYTKFEQLGEKGKEGTTYLVKDRHGKEYAMKTFRREKSSKTLKMEYSLQKKAGKKNITPRVYDYDTVSKYIVMEKMDSHLYENLGARQGAPGSRPSSLPSLQKKQQERILDIFRKLDEVGVFHGDANILNYMLKDGEIYIIDFGFSKEITPKLIKKLGTDRPNYHLMTVGLIIKLKEMNLPSKSYKYLLRALPVEYKEKYKLTV